MKKADSERKNYFWHRWKFVDALKLQKKRGVLKFWFWTPFDAQMVFGTPFGKRDFQRLEENPKRLRKIPQKAINL